MFNIQHIQIIQTILDYIDENIKEKIEFERLAQMAGYSPYHFSRIFHKYTGYTLMDYVIKRKLQFALHDLTCGKKIIDIAIDYGFESHSGFTKSFKKCFGSPPSLYKLHCPISSPQRLVLMDVHQKQLGGVLMQPKIIRRPTFTVIGQMIEGDLNNISRTRDEPAYWHEKGLTDGTIEKMLYETVKPLKHGEYCINLSSDEPYNRFNYLFSVESNQSLHIPSGLTRLEIPEATYAIFKTPSVEVSQFVNSIKGTWHYILENWFPQSAYEIDEDALDFEYYDEHCHPWEYEKVYMEIHIPIIKRNK